MASAPWLEPRPVGGRRVRSQQLHPCSSYGRQHSEERHRMCYWLRVRSSCRGGWIFFFSFSWTKTKSMSIKKQKRTRGISSHLDRTVFVNKGFIIWPERELFLATNAGNPERARKLPARAPPPSMFTPTCSVEPEDLLKLLPPSYSHEFVFADHHPKTRRSCAGFD